MTRAVFAVAAALVIALAGSPLRAQPMGGTPLDQAMDRLNSDPVGARTEIEALAAAGDAEAMNVLAAILISDTIDWPAEPERARALLEAAAAGGSAAAQVNLATHLLHEADPTGHARAIDLLREAQTDERIEPLTWFPWGYAYLFGRGVDRDLTQGAANLWRAVEVHPANAEAQFLLARAYQNGWGMPAPDPDLAYRHMRIAADAGEARAQWHVGMMLLNGEGVSVDRPEAYRFVRASGEAGHLPGMVSTAVMLATGEGVQENDIEARGWYQRAAERGSAHALRGLAGMLLMAEGGPEDIERGVAYLELARDGGDANAAAILAQFTIPDDPALRARLNRIKTEWIARHGRPMSEES